MHTTPWFAVKPRATPRLRLFCFPYAGGNAQEFLAWQDKLDPSIEVWAAQLPGRGQRWREAPHTRLPALVREMAAHLPQHDSLPFAFFGHSLGALVAFELARLCQLLGLRLPAQLFVSGCDAPRHRSLPRGLHLLPDGALIDALRSYGGTPADVLAHLELMQLVLPALRADFELVDHYRPVAGLPLPMPLTVLAGRRDAHVDERQVDGWGCEAAAGCSVHWFDGDHFFIQSGRAEVLRLIEKVLAAEMAPASPTHKAPRSLPNRQAGWRPLP